jgi:WhiB family redox-sensing transcriptional regulator
MDWRINPDRGCAYEDPELFFPDPRATWQAEAAKAVCLDCPVQQQCLDFALATRAEGVWGGTSDAERKELVEQTRRPTNMVWRAGAA